MTVKDAANNALKLVFGMVADGNHDALNDRYGRILEWGNRRWGVGWDFLAGWAE